MKRNTVFLAAGGDMRQLYAAKKLAEDYRVYIIGFPKNADTGNAVPADDISQITEKADCLILPLPVSADNIFLNAPMSERKIPVAVLKSAVKENAVITGGRVTEQIERIFGVVEDYSKREDFAVANAVPTAEAAVQIAMENYGKTLYRSPVLIVGAGRISKALAKILKGFGAEVTVAARKKSDLLWAEIFGCKGAEISGLENTADKYELIFNTVPAPVLKKSVLEKLKPDTVIIDLASSPGGTDFEYAEKHNIKAFLSLSLPGKYSPVTAGEIIAQTILNLLTERRFPE